jgi:hypothetical protein
MLAVCKQLPVFMLEIVCMIAVSSLGIIATTGLAFALAALPTSFKYGFINSSILLPRDLIRSQNISRTPIMPRIFRLPLIAFTVIAVAISVRSSHAQSSGKELLANPNFSSGDSHWFFQDASIETLDASSGSKQALLEGVNSAPKSWSHVGTEVAPVPLDHELAFSCRMRGTRSKQQLMINAFAYDSSEQLLKSWSSSFSVKENEWIPVSTKYVAPANASSLTLWVINQTNKRAYVSQPSMVLGDYQKSEIVLAKKPKTSSTSKKKQGKAKSDQDYQYDEHISGWIDYTAHNAYEVGLDKAVHHSGTRSAYIKSVGPKPTEEFGNLMQAFVPNNYLDQRVKLTAWVKTQLTSGTAQLWMRVDGEWNDSATKPGTFDNMDDRPIKGNTDWTPYSIVVDIPPNANDVSFGLMHIGTGTIWLDDVGIERVGKDVPLTGSFTTLTGCGKKELVNLNFEDEGK